MRQSSLRVPLSQSLAVALSCFIGSSAIAQDLTPSGDPAPLRAVRLIEPGDATARRDRMFFGRVAARETTALSFEVGGRLVELAAREGSKVANGAVIARLDPEPFERAMERAELTLAQAERDAARIATLAERNVAADVAAQDAVTGLNLAKVALRDARAALQDATLPAPFDGLVAERLATEFTNVTPGQPVLALHDLSEVRVEIEMPERVLLRAGGIDQIAFAAQLPNGTETDLALREFEPQTGRVGQSFRVSLAIPDAAASGLLPGASLTVAARLPASTGAQAIPAAAILGTTDRGFEVMVFHPDAEDTDTGTVAPAEIAVSTPDGVTLTVDGLPEGAAIVAAGAHLLKPGERVRRYDGLVPEEP